MTNQIRNSNECQKCFIEFLKDCFNTLYDTSVIVGDGSHIEEEDRRLFKELSIEKRELVVDSLSDIMDYNPNFNKIGKYYIVRIDQPINQKKLANRIKNQFKYIFYKARLFAVIKFFLILFQLYVTIIIVNAKNKCTGSKKGSNDKSICINPNIKFKILKNEIDAILFLKLFYFSCYDFVYFIHDLYFLKNLKKKKYNKYLAIFYQTLGHICNLAISIILIINIKNSYKIKHDKDDFLEETLEIISTILFDSVKFLMK